LYKILSHEEKDFDRLVRQVDQISAESVDVAGVDKLGLKEMWEFYHGDMSSKYPTSPQLTFPEASKPNLSLCIEMHKFNQ
jgi:hypothetical protein